MVVGATAHMASMVSQSFASYWILDTTSTNHMASNIHCLDSLVTCTFLCRLFDFLQVRLSLLLTWVPIPYHPPIILPMFFMSLIFTLIWFLSQDWLKTCIVLFPFILNFVFYKTSIVDMWRGLVESNMVFIFFYHISLQLQLPQFLLFFFYNWYILPLACVSWSFF